LLGGIRRLVRQRVSLLQPASQVDHPTAIAAKRHRRGLLRLEPTL